MANLEMIFGEVNDGFLATTDAHYNVLSLNSIVQTKSNSQSTKVDCESVSQHSSFYCYVQQKRL